MGYHQQCYHQQLFRLSLQVLTPLRYVLGFPFHPASIQLYIFTQHFKLGNVIGTINNTKSILLNRWFSMVIFFGDSVRYHIYLCWA